MEQAKVYFTKNINKESLIKIYEAIGVELKGKVAVKISTGEPGGHHYLDPKLICDLVKKLKGTIVECNTAYMGKRYHSNDHWQAIKDHGFLDIAKVDLMDEEGDFSLPIPGGRHLKENFVGRNLAHYDSILILSHFKGHAMGGFGGALKNMSIGIASSRGKAWIHSAGKTQDCQTLWEQLPEQDDFLESMAEADKAVMEYRKDQIVYINVMNHLSIDCDCDKDPEEPCMKDIGILGSTDPVALDQACLDLIYQSQDSGRDHFLERVESRNGAHLIDYATSLGLGSKQYKKIIIDEK